MDYLEAMRVKNINIDPVFIEFDLCPMISEMKKNANLNITWKAVKKCPKPKNAQARQMFFFLYFLNHSF